MIVLTWFLKDNQDQMRKFLHKKLKSNGGSNIDKKIENQANGSTPEYLAKKATKGRANLVKRRKRRKRKELKKPAKKKVKFRLLDA